MEKPLLDYTNAIFTTGAFLVPTRIKLNGKDLWTWTVSEFIDDSFKDGIVYNPREYAEKNEDLLKNLTPEYF
jgi:hypothetical protein